MDTLGQRLKQLRRRRRMTQQQLAGEAGISVDLIRKLEQSQRYAVRLDNLHRLANALDAPVYALIGKTPGLPAGGEQREVLELRRAVHGHLPELLHDPRSPELVRAGLDDLWRLYWTGRYAQLARAVPPALAEARAAVRAATSDQRPGAHALVAETLQVAASLLAHLTYEDLAHVALLHAVAEAERADDPVLRAAQHATTTWVMARQGLWREAEQLATRVAAQVEPTLSRASADEVAVWGELLRYGITAVMRDGRRDEAQEMQGLVDAAASAMGGRRPRLAGVVTFGPAVAGMSAVGIAVATDEPRRALELAERVRRIDTAPLTVQARYLLNIAYAQMMDWRSAEAVETLRQVDALAPEVLPYQTIARAIVEELLPRRRTQRLPGLVGIAERVGVPVE